MGEGGLLLSEFLVAMYIAIAAAVAPIRIVLKRLFDAAIMSLWFAAAVISFVIFGDEFSDDDADAIDDEL